MYCKLQAVLHTKFGLSLDKFILRRHVVLPFPHFPSPPFTSPHLTSHPLTSLLSAGSVAEDNSVPYYAEKCTAMFGVTYSSGNNAERRITTTDVTWRSGGCSTGSTGLTGTSASAPMAAGMIALMLDAR